MCRTPQDYVDDVKFLKVLAKRISDTFSVNESMIFCSGFSNGCSMIHKLAIDAGDVFAAVAGTSANLTVGDSARPIHRIPVWLMVGSLDDRFIVPPFTELPFGGDSILGYLKVLSTGLWFVRDWIPHLLKLNRIVHIPISLQKFSR